MKYQFLVTALIATVAGKPYESSKGSTYDSPNSMSPQEIIDSFEAIGTDKYVDRDIPSVDDYKQNLIEAKNSNPGKYVDTDTSPYRDNESFQDEESLLNSLIEKFGNLKASFEDTETENFDLWGIVKSAVIDINPILNTLSNVISK